jgi:ribonucleoside-diphosphate reductase alpha chain
MKLSDNSIKILESRYLLKNSNGHLIETPEELFVRVAKHVATAERHFPKGDEPQKWENEFLNLMLELRFLPNSPTLMNAGTNSGQLSACFVLPVHDSIESIFTTLKNTALIHQSGGGTGFNFSNLRPNGDFISPNSGNASGPISFMRIFDAATENIKQGGRRRGANMGILNITHPDIEAFITSKNQEGELRNFNISVAITDEFMHAVINKEDWELKHPASGSTVKKISAVDLWNLILKNAWSSGDPGVIFSDTINRLNPTPELGNIECTNPCGEVPLLPYEACNLGSINISKFADPRTKEIKWHELEITISICQRFLDNVIEINDYLLPEIKALVTGNRKIGLGIMGWADLLIQLEIPYASEQAVLLAEKLMKFINEKARLASEKLAEERGAFANFNRSIFRYSKLIRNATRTSIAPTGTISIIADTSSSIEPLFALAITRKNILNNQTISEVNQHFVDYVKKRGFYTTELIELVEKTGSIKNTALPEDIKSLFKTALEIEPIWHLRHQLAFQKHTDNAVSKTINIPFESDVEKISDIFHSAWKDGAKGITIFRQGSKTEQVLHVGTNPDQSACTVCRN